MSNLHYSVRVKLQEHYFAPQLIADLLVAYYLTDNLVRHVVFCGLPTKAMATKSVQLTLHLAVQGSGKWNLEVSTDSANNTSINL